MGSFRGLFLGWIFHIVEVGLVPAELTAYDAKWIEVN
jgi:hypothetical protein